MRSVIAEAKRTVKVVEFSVYFVFKKSVVTGLRLIAAAVQCTTLNHEIFNNTGERCSIVKALFGKRNPVLYGNRCFLREEAHLDDTGIRGHDADFFTPLRLIQLVDMYIGNVYALVSPEDSGDFPL